MAHQGNVCDLCSKPIVPDSGKIIGANAFRAAVKSGFSPYSANIDTGTDDMLQGLGNSAEMMRNAWQAMALEYTDDWALCSDCAETFDNFSPEDSWEKRANSAARSSGRWKFLVVGVVIMGAIAYLLFSGTGIGARYYVTVDELVSDPNMLGKSARVSGAVDGDPVFNAETKELTFVIANIPNDNDAIRDQGGLAKVLYNAVNDRTATRLKVVAHDQEIPDLLQHEAQAIMSGKLQEVEGEFIFYAEEITLKCPTKYEEDVPNQVMQ